MRFYTLLPLVVFSLRYSFLHFLKAKNEAKKPLENHVTHGFPEAITPTCRNHQHGINALVRPPFSNRPPCLRKKIYELRGRLGFSALKAVICYIAPNNAHST